MDPIIRLAQIKGLKELVERRLITPKQFLEEVKKLK